MSPLARVALAVLLCCSVPARPALTQATMPRSATGQFLSDWIDAVNAGIASALNGSGSEHQVCRYRG